MLLEYTNVCTYKILFSCSSIVEQVNRSYNTVTSPTLPRSQQPSLYVGLDCQIASGNLPTSIVFRWVTHFPLFSRNAIFDSKKFQFFENIFIVEYMSSFATFIRQQETHQRCLYHTKIKNISYKSCFIFGFFHQNSDFIIVQLHFTALILRELDTTRRQIP